MVVEERERWRAEQDGLMRHLEEAWHWRQNAEEYDACLQRYYIQRAKHQQRAVRLNQVLYGHTIMSAANMMEVCEGDAENVDEETKYRVWPVRKRSFGARDQENQQSFFKGGGEKDVERPCKASRCEHSVMRVIQ
jgi:hypothetical protein